MFTDRVQLDSEAETDLLSELDNLEAEKGLSELEAQGIKKGITEEERQELDEIDALEKELSQLNLAPPSQEAEEQQQRQAEYA